MKDDKNAKKIVVVLGLMVPQGHQQHRVHTNSYSTIIETMCILYRFRVIALLLVICRKWLIITFLTCVWRPRRGLSRSNFVVTFRVRKLESLGYRVALFV